MRHFSRIGLVLLLSVVLGSGASLAAKLYETDDPDSNLVVLSTLIKSRKMSEFFDYLSKVANLDNPLKNYNKKAIETLGKNLKNLFAKDETIHYVDKVRDETFGLSLRKVIYLVYTSTDRWIYFTFVLKRGATGWQFTRFSYAPEPIRMFPAR